MVGFGGKGSWKKKKRDGPGRPKANEGKKEATEMGEK